MLQHQNNDAVWGRNEDESLVALLHYYTKWYCQYYVYIARLIDDPHSAAKIVKKIFLSLWKMKNDIKSEEQIKTNLFKLADIHCSEYYKMTRHADDMNDESWEKIWGKSKEFLHFEKEIATIVGKFFEQGFFNPFTTQYYKDPNSGYPNI